MVDDGRAMLTITVSSNPMKEAAHNRKSAKRLWGTEDAPFSGGFSPPAWSMALSVT
jgi:hypothetical protein